MYKDIRAVVAADFDAVNQFIVDKLYSDVALVESIGHYIIDAGGKRMRPVLVLLSARSCGYEGSQHIDLASVIEFIHTATLLHDDVVDMSSMRRGRPTANEQWSNPSSVLVGDFIYSRAFQVLVSIGSMDIMRIMADTTNRIAEGEVLQLINKNNSAATQESYMAVIRHKTAILFQAAAACGAILAGASAEQQKMLGDIGMHIGLAFQLIDDVLDYEGDASAMGKNIGDDLAEGKPTLPLIHAMRTGSAEDSALIKRCIESAAKDDKSTLDPRMLQDVIAIIQASGSLDYTRQLANAEADKALALIASLKDTPYRRALEDMARFSVQRST
ncbi:MAG: polyprenyl synthetase family protein [Pseudomonadales bacterium]|nr:polyprenyl synthetase family protein [Pseudomonadales bacterium]MCP5330984.1 polyprenyl synthetase family protein [Pseudomonadales bacterium]MCP5344614.1 polyprenyl synthetase family protein [Pseudomonadales bacterium]